MHIRTVHIRNFCSVVDAKISLGSYGLLVGPNNAGKSTIINALRTFYGDRVWTAEDWPKDGADGDEAWIEVEYGLTDEEVASLREEYQLPDNTLRVRRYFKSAARCKAKQSNLYAYRIDGELEENLFYGMKSVGISRLGNVVYIPALSVPSEHLKTSGPSVLRNMLTFVLKRIVKSSAAYQQVQDAFDALNREATDTGGMLEELKGPINERLLPYWGIELDLEVRPVSPEDITKNLIQHGFKEPQLSDDAVALDRYGHGFQRSVIFELISMAAEIEVTERAARKDFDPDFTLLLFEEPEAFLHPDQQATLALNLRALAEKDGQQIIASTHSSIFVGRSAQDLTEIIRVSKPETVSQVNQLSSEQVEELFGDGRGLQRMLEGYRDDPGSKPEEVAAARRLLATTAPVPEEVAFEEEQFRQQLWLEGDRAAMFFAGKVLICEGPSERALLNYLLCNDWMDLRNVRVFVADTLGKYNAHRFIALLDAFQIPFSVMIDGDEGRGAHALLNPFILDLCNGKTLGDPVVFPVDVEEFLGIDKPRPDKKPVSILMKITNGDIPADRLKALREEFVKTLDISEEAPSD